LLIFQTVIYENLGVKSVAQRLGYNLANQVVSAFCAISAATLTDRMPRRRILPSGTFMCAVLLAINAGLSAVLDDQTKKTDAAANTTGENFINKNVAQGALAFYFLFNCMYSFTYTPLQGVVPVEALTTTMRAKGLAASGFIVSAIGFINQFAGPVGLQNLGVSLHQNIKWQELTRRSTSTFTSSLDGTALRLSSGTSSVSSRRAVSSR